MKMIYLNNPFCVESSFFEQLLLFLLSLPLLKLSFDFSTSIHLEDYYFLSRILN